MRPTSVVTNAQKSNNIFQIITSHANARKHSLYVKNAAALKLAAVFRGKLARVKVEREKRKQAAQNAQRQEEEREANIPRQRAILRPKGKSYIGF